MAGTGEIRAGAAYVEFFLRDNKFVRGLAQVQGHLRALGTGLMRVGAGVMAAGAAVYAPLLAAAKMFATMGDAITEMGVRTGMGVEFLQALGHAAELGGTDLAELEVGIRRFQKSAYEASKGSEGAAKGFKALGISVKGADGQIKPIEQLFSETSAALSDVENETTKAAIAVLLFGRAGTRILPVLKNMGDARRLGIVMSPADIESAHELSHAFDRMRAIIRAVAYNVGAALAPKLIDLGARLASVSKTVIDWFKANRELVVSVAKVAGILTVAGAAITGIGAALYGVSLACGAVIGGFGFFSHIAGLVSGLAAVLAALLTPIGLVSMAVVGLGSTLLITSGQGARALDWLGQKFGELRDRASQTVQGIVDALVAGNIAAAGKILWISLRTAWAEGMASLQAMWVNFKYDTAEVMNETGLLIQTIWAQTIAAMKIGWINFGRDCEAVWSNASSTIAKGIGWILAKIQGLNPEEVAANVEHEYAEWAKKSKGLDTNRKAAILAELESELGGYAGTATGTEKALQSQRKGELHDAMAGVAGAQAELESALADIARKREIKEAWAGFDWGTAGKGGGGAADVVAASQGPAGTYSAEALGMLGGARNPLAKVERETERAARFLERIEARTGWSGFAWT